MHSFEMTPWGRFQLRLWLVLIGMLLLTNTGGVIWLITQTAELDVLRISILVVLALVSAWIFIYLHRAYTSVTLTFHEEGIAYRTLLGRSRMFYWREVIYSAVKGDWRDYGPVSRHFYDERLILYRRSVLYKRDVGGIFPPWPHTVSIPIFAYEEPDKVQAFVMGHLLSDEVYRGSAPPDELDSMRISAAEDAAMLAHARNWRENPPEELTSLGTMEAVHLCRKARRYTILFIVLALATLPTYFVIARIFGDDAMAHENHWLWVAALLGGGAYVFGRWAITSSDDWLALRHMLSSNREAHGE